MSTKIVVLDEKTCCHYFLGMSPEQCRAARAWLGLSQDDLAIAAGVSNSTLRDYEAGRRTPIANNLKAIQAELEKQGAVFWSDEETFGLSFPKSVPKTA